MITAFRNSGVRVLPVDAETITRPSAEVARLIRRFGADFIVSVNLNYLLAAAPQADSFVDELDIPVVVWWDDPLGALSLNSMNMYGGRMGQLNRPRQHTLQAFANVLARPNLKHLAWDTGHMRTVNELQLALPKNVHWLPVATYQPYLEHGADERPRECRFDLAFCGNIYAGLISQSSFATSGFWPELTSSICDTKAASLEVPVWDIFRKQILGLPTETKSSLGLDPDNSIFWDYYIYCVWLAGNTAVRLAVLGEIQHHVNVFGLFADPDAVSTLGDCSNLEYRGSVDHFRELPAVYSDTKINICIGNALIQQGTPSKLIDCVASGGFALSDPKEDLRTLFGDLADSIFFRNSDELNAKIEYFLPRPDERRQISRELWRIAAQHCTLESMVGRIMKAIQD
jgi:hypothetical protein